MCDIYALHGSMLMLTRLVQYLPHPRTLGCDQSFCPHFLTHILFTHHIHESHVLLLSIRDHFRACADQRYWKVPRFSIQRKVERKRNRLEPGLKNVRKQNLKA
jgi:hypothetical protein